MSVSQHVKNGVGALILWGLGQGLDVDGGWFIELPDLSIGNMPNDTPIGSWRIEVRRVSKPLPAPPTDPSLTEEKGDHA